MKMYTELFHLNSKNGEKQWTAAGRWLKYEQTVEGADNCWSRPRVPVVAFQAIQQFKLFLSNGLVLLDPAEIRNFCQLKENLRLNLINEQKLPVDEADRTVQLLTLMQVRYESNTSKAVIYQAGAAKEPLRGSVSLDQSASKIKNSVRVRSRRLRSRPTLIKQITSFSFEAEHPIEAILGENAEATQIFAGCLQSELKSTFVMVRMANAIYLPELIQPSINVRMIFLIVGPLSADVDFCEIGRAIGCLMTNKMFAEMILKSESREQLISELDLFLNETLVIPPSDMDRRAVLDSDMIRKRFKCRAVKLRIKETQNHISKLGEECLKTETTPVLQISNVYEMCSCPLQRTRRPFGGLVNDIKNRAPFLLDDFKSALNFQCLTGVVFIFFANFASAIAFGEVISTKTDGVMGITEILIAHGICNVLWGFFAGQPLCILAEVGPFLVFETSLFIWNIDVLPVRFWVGLWTFVLMTFGAMIEAPFLMKRLTRFTEEIFTGLISAIFILEAFKFLINEFKVGTSSIVCKNFNSSLTNDSLFLIPNETKNYSALVSFIFLVTTFACTVALKKLRNSVYCGRTIRRALGDFGVPLTVLLLTVMDQSLFSRNDQKHIEMPVEFSLTRPDVRGWFVYPLGVQGSEIPTWVIPCTLLPAVLLSILLFAEVEIIEGMLMKSERGLKKPAGFHWDLVVSGALVFLCSVLGIQWMCPAAVQTLSHANALTVMKKCPPGETPKVEYVIEQRVTSITVGILHVAAAFFGAVLNLIPASVLFGLFLYLGIIGLSCLQFFERFLLFFVPRKYFPCEAYCTDVSMWRMHLFTFVQLICFCLLWSVNIRPESALSFPFVLLLIAVLRSYIVPLIFDTWQLNALDGISLDSKLIDSRSFKDDLENKDFYEQAAVPI